LKKRRRRKKKEKKRRRKKSIIDQCTPTIDPTEYHNNNEYHLPLTAM
jgi:hypothetical protein